MEPSLTPIKRAVLHLGGQAKTAEILGKVQSRVSDYVRSGKPPAEVCIKIELATKGKFTAEQLRPDLADAFKAFRAGRKAKRARAA